MNASGDDIDWSVDNSNTPSSSTGPSNDHTSGSGRYLYTEASSCFNKTGYIYTPCFDFSSASGPSLNFWYHMYGSNMGTLSIQASTDGGTSWSPNLYSISGDQGNSWKEANVNVNTYAGNSTVLFRITGATGSSWQSDIAIDDFTVNAGSGEIAENEENTTSVEDQASSTEVGAELYPNPANEVIILKTTGLTNTVRYEILDMVGHQIKNISSSVVGDGTYEINVNNLSTGTYIMRIESDEYLETLRFNIVK